MYFVTVKEDKYDAGYAFCFETMDEAFDFIRNAIGGNQAYIYEFGFVPEDKETEVE